MAIPSKNSDLYRRLRLYGFGFLLGLLIVNFVYKGKGCQMPNSAKMEELSWQKLQYTPHSGASKPCRNITEADIKQVLKNGKVNYSMSDVRHKPYSSYAVEGLSALGRKLRIMIDDVDTISKVTFTIDLSSEKDTCDCR